MTHIIVLIQVSNISTIMHYKRIKHLCLYFCIGAYSFNTFTPASCIRFQPHIESNTELVVDGSYSIMTSLASRLPFANLSLQAMTRRHLWCYMSILTLALDNLQDNALINIGDLKFKLMRAIRRLQYTTLPDMKYLAIGDSYHYQVDASMLKMVHEDLKAILVPPPASFNTNEDQLIDTFLSVRAVGTTAMFRKLFEYWDIIANPAVIQLLARSYLPVLYIIHMAHDGDYIYHQSLFDNLYSLLHQHLVPFQSFQFLGLGNMNAQQYELALILADSLCETHDDTI